MEITLEKIELVKDRTGVSYKEAKEALEAADGNVVDAIIAIEETINLSAKNKATEQAKQVVENIKEAVAKGNVARIRIKKEDDVVLNVPVNVGIIGTVIAPWAAIIGVIAAFGTKCVIELVKTDGSIVDVSDKANDTFDDLKEKGGDAFETVKEKGSTVAASAAEKFHEFAAKGKTVAKEKGDDFKDTVDEMWEEAKKRVSKTEEESEAAVEAATETPAEAPAEEPKQEFASPLEDNKEE
jgi:gas vesicle protein